MPADCGPDFECTSSPQPPAVTTECYQTSHGEVGIKYRDCMRIGTGMTNVQEQESANDTHNVHNIMAGSQPGMSTDQENVLESQHNLDQVR